MTPRLHERVLTLGVYPSAQRTVHEVLEGMVASPSSQGSWPSMNGVANGVSHGSGSQLKVAGVRTPQLQSSLDSLKL